MPRNDCVCRGTGLVTRLTEDGNTGPEVCTSCYVAVDTLLTDEAILEAAARAYVGERWWDSLPVDNEQKESHRRAMADALEAAIAAASTGGADATDAR